MSGTDQEIADVLRYLDEQMAEFERIVSRLRQVDEDVEFAIPEDTLRAVSEPMVGCSTPCFAIRA